MTLGEHIQKVYDRRTFTSEGHVKKFVHDILGKASVFTFMPPANQYGRSGISDIVAIKYGRVVFIETKYKYNEPTANQEAFGDRVEAHGAVFVVINERNAVARLCSIIQYFETKEWVGERRL